MSGSITEHPVFKKWYAETMHMVATAQLAEDTVALVDGRPARRAALAFEGDDRIKVVYEPTPIRHENGDPRSD